MNTAHRPITALVGVFLLTSFASRSEAALILGLDAHDITQANGTAVANWSSTSAAGVGSVSQTTAALQPTFLTSSTPLGGMPGVEFDDIDDGMISTVAGLGTDYSILSLYAYRQTTTNAARVVQGGNGTRNAQAAAAGNNWLIGPYNGDHRLYDGGFINSGNTSTAPVISTALGSAGANNEFFLNGSLVGSNGNNNAPNVIGLGSEGAWAESADSDIGLVLVFDDRLTDDERIGVEYYMAQAYGLSGFTATDAQLAAARDQLQGFLVPEPSRAILLFLGGAACLLRRRR